MLSKQFGKYFCKRKLDKTAVKKTIENGETVPGAILTNGTRLIINSLKSS